jgi:beta-glucosidase
VTQSIQDEYGGWVDDKIVGDFTAYATAAFTAFGNRTSKWMTFNEPKNFCFLGYGTGFHAPGVRVIPSSVLRIVRPFFILLV